VLGILLDNAASYTPKAGDIQLGISSARGHLLLWVADNGPGIPDSSKKIIFDRFYRGDASRKDKRHFGLGLCIAKELIQLHQGKIWVEDNQPTGSVFYISLPAAL
jgi:signal transduction histidine kinase